MPRCNGCSADDDYDDFEHFIFKAHFENFLEFLDSPTKEVSYKTPHGLSNETSLSERSQFFCYKVTAVFVRGLFSGRGMAYSRQ